MSSIYSDWEAKIRSCAGDVINQALDDPLTCDVMVNPDGRIWQERFGEPMKCIGMMESYNLESMIRFLASILHKTVSYEQPRWMGSIGGFRFSGAIPPIVSSLHHTQTGQPRLHPGGIPRVRNHNGTPEGIPVQSRCGTPKHSCGWRNQLRENDLHQRPHCRNGAPVS